MTRAHVTMVHVQDIRMLSPSYVLNVSWTTPSVAQVHSVGWLACNELETNQRTIYSVKTTVLANNLPVYHKPVSLLTYFEYKEKSSSGISLLKWKIYTHEFIVCQSDWQWDLKSFVFTLPKVCRILLFFV